MSPHFFEAIVVRTASVPLSDYNLNNRDFINKHKAFFDEAIYLSSPSLYQRYRAYLSEDLKPKDLAAFELTIRKFISRMCYRTVPFKRFSAIGTGSWGDRNQLQYKASRAINAMDYVAYSNILHLLLRKPEIAKEIRYFTNRNLYRNEEALFFIKEQQFQYSLEGANTDELLDHILSIAKDGICFSDIIQQLKEMGIDTEDAILYTNELIGESILLAGWKSVAQGNNRWTHLTAVLQSIQKEKNSTEIEALIAFLEQLNQSVFSQENNSISDYQEAFLGMKKWFPDLQENYFFDSLNELKDNQFTLHKTMQSRLIKAATVLHKLFPEKTNPDLLRFKNDFYKRYGNATVALLEVFHPESGLHYAGIRKNLAKLLEGVSFPVSPAIQQYTYLPAQQMLSQKLHEAQKHDAQKIILSDQDFNNIAVPKEEVSNPTATINFRIAGKGKKIILDNYNRSTASKMIGKHGYQSPQIAALVKEIHQYESKAVENDIIPAELCFLPNQKAGSICNYPHYREKQIQLRPHSSESSKDIPLDDLYIRLEQGRMQIFSKKYNKEIRPFLSTPYLSHLNNFPLFRFLAAMSHDNHTRFSWHRIPAATEHHYLPRIEYKDVILKEAQWKITYKEYYSELVSKQFDQQALASFSKKRKLPRYIVVTTDGDRLLIDCLDAISIASIEKELKKLEQVWCSESFVSDDDLICQNESLQKFHSDFYAFVKQDVKAAATPSIVYKDIYSETRANEWLYFKIYVNPDEVNALLTNELNALIASAAPYIQKWFFVRYDDGMFHIRLRFHLKSLSDRLPLFDLADTLLRSLLQKKKIRSFQLDQYQAEKDRYKTDGLEKTEQIFYHDSLFAISVLECLQNENAEENDWLIAFLAANSWLTIYNKNTALYPEMMKPIKDSFDMEFKTDKNLRKTIKQQFEARKETLDLALNKTVFSEEIYRLLKNRNEAIATLKPEASLFDYMHMSANRLLSYRHRQQELFVAHFLDQWYRILNYKNTAHKK